MGATNTKEQQNPDHSETAEGTLPKITGIEHMGNHLHSELNAGAGDPTDGRKEYEWESRYPRAAIVQIRCEAFVLSLILLISLLLIFATWKGWVGSIFSLSPREIITLKKYSYYIAAGLLGGTAFSVKYFYRCVARGYWHQDRRVWRFMSPLIATSIAFIVGTMIDASFVQIGKPISGATIVTIGFLSGHFADHAVAKMYELASVIFGKSSFTKSGDGK